MPCDLVAAIQHAETVLAWYDNLTEDEMPPRWMWTIPEELEIHFDNIKEQRRGERDDEPLSGVALQNEYARDRGRNAR